MARTVAELAARELALMAQLSEVREEIAARAGQVDPPVTKPTKK